MLKSGKLVGSSAWRDESSGDCKMSLVVVLPWCAAEDSSRHEGWRQEKLGHQLLTAVAVMWHWHRPVAMQFSLNI